MGNRYIVEPAADEGGFTPNETKTLNVLFQQHAIDIREGGSYAMTVKTSLTRDELAALVGDQFNVVVYRGMKLIGVDTETSDLTTIISPPTEALLLGGFQTSERSPFMVYNREGGKDIPVAERERLASTFNSNNVLVLDQTPQTCIVEGDNAEQISVLVGPGYVVLPYNQINM